MASSTSLTNADIKHRILNSYAQFVSDVDPERLFDWLVQEHVITIDQKLRIRLENPMTSDRCRALLDHLFSTQHPRAFLVVRQALSKENHYLLEHIDKQERECELGDHPATKAVLQAKIQELENDLMISRSENTQLRRKEEDLKQRVHQLESEFHSDCRSKILNLEENLKQEQKEKERLVEENRRMLVELKSCDLVVLHESSKSLVYHIIQNVFFKFVHIIRKWFDSLYIFSCWFFLCVPLSVYIASSVASYFFVELRHKSNPVLVETIRTKAAKDEIKSICGLAILDEELFVVSQLSSEVEVYDLIKLSFSRRWKLKEFIDPMDIESCHKNKCLYICDYKADSKSKEILRVDIKGKLIKKWSTGNDYQHEEYHWKGYLSVTDKSNIILTVFSKNKLTEYSPVGQLIREINLSDAGIRHPLHAMKLANGQFVVSHGCYDGNHRVCIVDADGKLKKSFGGECGSTIGQADVPICLVADGNGFVMVADRDNNRVLLLDSDLKFKRVILSRDEHGLRHPKRILLDEPNGRLFVADNRLDTEKKQFGDGRILVFGFK